MVPTPGTPLDEELLLEDELLEDDDELLDELELLEDDEELLEEEVPLFGSSATQAASDRRATAKPVVSKGLKIPNCNPLELIIYPI